MWSNSKKKRYDPSSSVYQHLALPVTHSLFHPRLKSYVFHKSFACTLSPRLFSEYWYFQCISGIITHIMRCVKDGNTYVAQGGPEWAPHQAVDDWVHT